jgi:nicotinate-nucleotide--dimethylbenzimidazole phosphoribosyltransferase
MEETCFIRPEPEDYREWPEEDLWELFSDLALRIGPADQAAFERCGLRWSRVAKPLGSLGALERDIQKLAAISGTENVRLRKKALVVFCADNGVVEEGVTQTGQEVTAVVTANFTRGESCSCLMAAVAGADVFPVDIGVACELGPLGDRFPLIDRKIRNGCGNFTKGPAMTRREALAAVLTGMDMARALKEAGYDIVAAGEMGIGNTTASSAVTAALLSADPEKTTGRGAGLSSEGLCRKIDAVKRGLLLNGPDPGDGLGTIRKVGGFDLAGLCGLCLGGAAYRIPVVLDGFISAAAAAAARALDRHVPEYLLASHVSAEPAGERLLRFLGLEPAIRAGFCLGEGSGALTLFPLLDMALEVYSRMRTFEEIQIEEYRPL